MRLVAVATAALFALLGCSAEPSGFHDSGHTDAGGGDTTVSNACTTAGQIVCMGNTAATCDDSGGYTDMQQCGTQTCVIGVGCSTCQPGRRSCDASGTPQVCNDTGTGYTPADPCPSGSTCSEGTCADPCSMAASTHSYIGCDYWFTSTLNSQLGSFPTTSNPNSAVGVAGFPFAVAIANPQTVAAQVTISGGGLSGMATTVAPGQLAIVQLPWIQSVSQVNQANHAPAVGHSVLAHNAAYHLASNVPVTVYDFNALSYQDVRHPHCNPDTDLTCFSFTNDASLLLPTNVLTGNYTVLAWPSETTQYMGSVDPTFGGFVTIIGTSTTPTNVTIHLTGSVGAGSSVSATAAGGTITETLQQGDVLELVSGSITTCTRSPQPIQYDDSIVPMPIYACQTNAAHDLTGSIITADQPVAVFGGHDCANIPYDKAACDHLEEELFPNETLGQHYLVSYTQPQLSPREPNQVRVMSNHAGNMITFTPSTVHAPVTLDRGAYIDFLQTADVEVQGSGSFAIAQYFVGEDYNGTSTSSSVGDPSMVLEVPVEQWRTSYEFLTPNTYTKSYVNVVAQHGANITLDGTALGVAPATVGAFDVYRVDISTRTGAHHIESSGGQTFGIKVYGFGAYTSYMYPGGLDLTQISPPG